MRARAKQTRDPAGTAAPPGPLVPRRWGRAYLAAELLLVFFAFPVALYFVRHQFGTMIIPTLLATGGACLLLLRRDPAFDRRRLWNPRRFGRRFGRTVVLFLPVAAALGLAYAVLEPERFGAFPRERPLLWLAVMLLYPLLSVYPQELIFRTFLFHRYRSLLAGRWSRVLVSAAAFGLAHLFFANWVAPVLSTLGGLLFARTYARTDSTLQASLEHSLWGDFLFTLGMGWYFYGGAIGR